MAVRYEYFGYTVRYVPRVLLTAIPEQRNWAMLLTEGIASDLTISASVLNPNPGLDPGPDLGLNLNLNSSLGPIPHGWLKYQNKI